MKLFFKSATGAADIILAGAGVGAVLVLCYSLYHYAWIGERQVIAWSGVAAYFIVPALVAALLFASLRMRSTYKIAAAVFCLLMVASVYVAEVVMFAPDESGWVEVPAGKKVEAIRLAKEHGIEFDTRNSFEVIADLRQRGVEAVPPISPRYLVRDQKAISIAGSEIVPLGGIAHKATVLCNQSGDYVIYESDQHGFHNPAGVWQSGGLDIAALGKSFTQGYCVPSDKNFVALIRDRYPATLNMGIATHGPLLMLAALKEYLPSFEPKVVLWFYVEGNHVLYLEDERKSPLLLRYLEDDFTQNLISRQSGIDGALMDYVDARLNRASRLAPEISKESGTSSEGLLRIVKLSALRQKLGLVYGTNTQQSADFDAHMNLFRDILSQAKNRVNGWAGTLYFVYLPSLDRYLGNDREGADRERTRVLAVADGLGISIIDLHPAFQAGGDPLSLFPFGRFLHYNERGHRIVAEEVLKSIAGKPNVRPASPYRVTRVCFTANENRNRSHDGALGSSTAI
jgi:hypothetical protein